MKKLWLLLSLMSTMSLNAVVVQIRQWKFGEQRFVCFKSAHVDYFPCAIGLQQQLDLLEYAKKLDALVTAEDMLSYAGSNNEIAHHVRLRNAALPYLIPYTDQIKAELSQKNLVSIEDEDGFLCGIIQKCAQAKIDCCNVECRYARAASKDGCAVPIKDVIAEFSNEMAELERKFKAVKIQANADFFSQKIYMYYVKAKKRIEDATNAFVTQLKNCPYTIKSFIDRGIKLSWHNDFGLNDRELLDLKTLYYLWENRAKKMIFICEGQGHITALESFFQDIGCIPEAVMGRDVVHTDLPETCLDIAKTVNIAKFFQEQNPEKSKLSISVVNRLGLELILSTAICALCNWYSEFK